VGSAPGSDQGIRRIAAERAAAHSPTRAACAVPPGRRSEQDATGPALAPGQAARQGPRWRSRGANSRGSARADERPRRPGLCRWSFRPAVPTWTRPLNRPRSTKRRSWHPGHARSTVRAQPSRSPERPSRMSANAWSDANAWRQVYRRDSPLHDPRNRVGTHPKWQGRVEPGWTLRLKLGAKAEARRAAISALRARGPQRVASISGFS